MKLALANPFFKKPERMITDMRYRSPKEKEMMARQKAMKEMYGDGMRNAMEHNNKAAVVVDAHPRYGFQTMLNHDSPVPLPTAPPVVGGNVDWTKLKATPATQHLHSVLSERRAMNPAPATGSGLRLAEPSRDSIHTNI